MSLPTPNLDDRTYEQLVEEAKTIIQRSCPSWTDLSAGDPGTVLLEVFAHLTEIMIYRLNRVPEKAYTEYLNLIGVRLYPPAAASAVLSFRLNQPSAQIVEIPRGTRVTASRTAGSEGEPPVFTTSRAATIPAGQTQVDVLAHHCELIEGELVGIGTGLPGLVLQVRRPPIIAPTGDALDLMVGIEAIPEELDDQSPIIQYQGKPYRLWSQVDRFVDIGADPHVYVADRMAGRITFAPAARVSRTDGTIDIAPSALGAVPPAGREIRLWYRRGGGPQGNVPAHTIETLREPIAGVLVTNEQPATGGRDAEDLANALVRGPQELHALQRAVTARDFELIALYSSRAISRVKAQTQAALWTFAAPGTVEVLLVPELPGVRAVDAGTGRRVSAADLIDHQSQVVRDQVQKTIDERKPLGTTCLVHWTRYKTVQALARIVVRRQENPVAVRERVNERLYQTISPLPTPLSPEGWTFGQALRASHIYDIALTEPGVLWVDQVRLRVADVPDQAVTTLWADSYQPHTWYAGSGSNLFRSLDDGDGWEPVGQFGGAIGGPAGTEQVRAVRAHPDRAGLLAVVTKLVDQPGSKVYLSIDAGESWLDAAHTFAFDINDAAWTLRDQAPVLLLAGDVGLYELALRPDTGPVQVLVDRNAQDLGFYAISVSVDVRGQTSVAVAAEGLKGVYLSPEGGRPGSFRPIVGLQGEDIRELAVQHEGPRAFLWAGAAVPPTDEGKGCWRWELRGSENPPEGWVRFQKGWKGGSVRCLAMMDSRLLAATHRAGVMRLDTTVADPTWESLDVRCGLPLRDPGRFQPVDAVAARGGAQPVVMAGGQEGVYSSEDGGAKYVTASTHEFEDKVTLPPGWLFCSGEHQISVVSEDEAERD